MTITNKTTRAQLIADVTALQGRVDVLMAHNERIVEDLRTVREERDAADLKVAELANDVSNLLGTIRVLSDPARPIRIRRSSVRDADMALASPRP